MPAKEENRKTLAKRCLLEGFLFNHLIENCKNLKNLETYALFEVSGLTRCVGLLGQHIFNRTGKFQLNRRLH